MKDFSQNGEQEIILQYFAPQEAFRGTFLDIGANDGVTLSNSWALAQLGWKGDLVEPAGVPFQKLMEHYRNYTGMGLHNVALSTHNGELTFYSSGDHLGQGDTDLLSTLSEKEMRKWQKHTQYTETKVRAITWEKFQERASYKKYDFVTIDCEGVDYLILSQMHLADMGVRLLIIEWNSVPAEKARIQQYMTGFNFHLIHQNGVNLIYAKK